MRSQELGSATPSRVLSNLGSAADQGQLQPAFSRRSGQNHAKLPSSSLPPPAVPRCGREAPARPAHGGGTLPSARRQPQGPGRQRQAPRRRAGAGQGPPAAPAAPSPPRPALTPAAASPPCSWPRLPARPPAQRRRRGGRAPAASTAASSEAPARRRRRPGSPQLRSWPRPPARCR